MVELAIIGAGVAGLAAARALRQRRPDLAVTIYEKSRQLGGRLATGRRDGYVFDHGAQYAKAPTPELARLLRAELPADQLHDIGLPVWIFDGAGEIAPGDPAQNADPKWTYRDGLDRLGTSLAADLNVRHELQIASLRRTENPESGTHAGAGGSRLTLRAPVLGSVPRSWSLLDRHERIVGAADLVLLTPPAPQAAALLAASDLGCLPKAALLAELARASYRRCISVALAYARPLERPFYALVNSDRAHPIAWLALEHAKAPERCPPGSSLIVAQMAPRWSLEQWELPVAELERRIAPLVSALLGADLGAPLWADALRWRDALPDGGADMAALNHPAAGLFFAGDYTAGLGRVHLAIESGWRAAGAIERALESVRGAL